AEFHASGWLPTTHKDYWEKYKDDLVKVNETLDKAPLALAVPEYVEDINSIEDLKDNKDFAKSVNNEIIGIDAGAGIMESTKTAIDEYKLDDWKLTSRSESAMITELRKAYKKEDTIVVPLLKPHWKFDVYDMKRLKDPNDVYGGDGDHIYIIANKDLEKDAPAAYKILEQYTEDYNMVEELMPPVFDEDKDPKDVARDFIDDNPELVEKWTDGV